MNIDTKELAKINELAKEYEKKYITNYIELITSNLTPVFGGIQINKAVYKNGDYLIQFELTKEINDARCVTSYLFNNCAKMGFNITFPVDNKKTFTIVRLHDSVDPRCENILFKCMDYFDCASSIFDTQSDYTDEYTDYLLKK